MTQPALYEHRALINGIACLLSDNVICAKTWGFYIFSDEFADEPELRNKCGVIWLIALLDSIEGEARTLTKYETEARDRGLANLLVVCAQVRVFIRQVSAILALFSREEQLFLAALRDQWVHGWLNRRHQARFTIKYFDGAKVVSEELSHDSYHSTIRPLFEHPAGLDGHLPLLLDRAVRNELPYWQSIHALKNRIDEMIRTMLDGRDFKIPQLEA